MICASSLPFVYRNHLMYAADLLVKEACDAYVHGPYRHAGEVTEFLKRLDWGLSGWRVEPISTTRLAAWIPVLVSG